MCAELNKYAEALVYHIDMAVPANNGDILNIIRSPY